MTLLSLDIPTDATDLALWLESHFVGQTLGTLVSELAAVHGQQREFQIDHLIRNCKTELLEDGLQTLSANQLLVLIKNPGLLGDLQEIVLAEGGPYWQQQLRKTWQTHPSYQRGTQHLEKLVGTRPVHVAVDRRTSWQERRWAMSLLATSALLLVGFLGWRLVEPGSRSAAAWGWNSPKLLRASDSSVAYLDKLADAADEWFDERPQTRSELARRMKQLRTGCNRLITANHASLSVADRQWLVTRCRDWARKIDESFAKLESGTSPQVVRTEVDRLIRKLSQTLRSRQIIDPVAQLIDRNKLLYGGGPSLIKGTGSSSATLAGGRTNGSSYKLGTTLHAAETQSHETRDGVSLELQDRKNYPTRFLSIRKQPFALKMI